MATLLMVSCSKEEVTIIEEEILFVQKTGDGEGGDDIHETILDDNGNPECGITVQLDLSNGQNIDSDISDSNGDYLFDNLSPGDYKVTENPNSGNENIYYRRIY